MSTRRHPVHWRVGMNTVACGNRRAHEQAFLNEFKAAAMQCKRCLLRLQEVEARVRERGELLT